LAERTKRLVIGDPFDSTTQIGALISKKHFEKVMGYVRSGMDEGARIVCGGNRVEPGVTEYIGIFNCIYRRLFRFLAKGWLFHSTNHIRSMQVK
jgi:hypothetical protein